MRRSGLWLVAAALGVAGGWWVLLVTDDDSSDAGRNPQAEVIAGVCAARAAAADGDDARAAFYDRAHEGLHQLASDAASLDRSVAARLLRSKERVEAILDGEARGDATAALRELSEAASDAAAIVDPSSKESC